MSKQTKTNVSKEKKRQSIVIFCCLAAIVLTILYVNVAGLVDSYVDSFIFRGDESAEAVEYLAGLDEEPNAALTDLRDSWDNWRYSRLRDEVSITAADGTTLHGYYYEEGGDITAIFVPRYHQDGTADFLLAAELNALTGCNVLIPDPRTCGESGGEAFSYGFKEAADLTAWMDWAEEALAATVLSSAERVREPIRSSLLPQAAIWMDEQCFCSRKAPTALSASRRRIP